MTELEEIFLRAGIDPYQADQDTIHELSKMSPGELKSALGMNFEVESAFEQRFQQCIEEAKAREDQNQADENAAFLQLLADSNVKHPRLIQPSKGISNKESARMAEGLEELRALRVPHIASGLYDGTGATLSSTHISSSSGSMVLGHCSLTPNGPPLETQIKLLFEMVEELREENKQLKEEIESLKEEVHDHTLIINDKVL